MKLPITSVEEASYIIAAMRRMHAILGYEPERLEQWLSWVYDAMIEVP